MLELTFKRTYFVICQLPLLTALCIRVWRLIVSFHSNMIRVVVYIDNEQNTVVMSRYTTVLLSCMDL